MGDPFEPWSDFNVALVGATAALAGLAIVAASVNITEIVASRPLVARFGSGIANLVLVLVVCSLGLIPSLTLVWYGALALVTAVIAGVFSVAAARLILTDPNAADIARFPKVLLGFLPVLAYLVAAGLALAASPAALYIAAAGAIVGIASAVVVSWVALVEVLR